MNRIVSIRSQPLDDLLRYAHVGQETHSPPPSSSANFLVRQPSSILQRLLNVISFEVGITSQHLFPTGAVGDLPNNDGNWNAHAANAGSATHDFGVKRDTVEHGFILSFAKGATKEDATAAS